MVPGLEIVDEDTWLFPPNDPCVYRFRGLDQELLSLLLCIHCPDKDRVLPSTMNPEIIELYALIDI